MPKKKKTNKKDIQKPCVFHSEDKDFDNEPYENHYFSARPTDRIALISRPGHGKTSVIKNYLVHGGYQKIFIAAANSGTKEFELVDYTPIDFEKIDADFFVDESEKINKGRMCLILEDLNFQDMTKKSRTVIYQVLQHVCTHNNMCVMATAHTWSQMNARVRRICSVFVLWPPSEDQLSYQARGLSMSKDELRRAYSFCKGKYDFLVYEIMPPNTDNYSRTEWRLNGYIPIQILK